jgi:hypothetical protein
MPILKESRSDSCVTAADNSKDRGNSPATPGPRVEAAKNKETKNTRSAPVLASKLLFFAVSIAAIETRRNMSELGT